MSRFLVTIITFSGVSERKAEWAGVRQDLDPSLFVEEPLTYSFNFSLQRNGHQPLNANWKLNVEINGESQYYSILNVEVEQGTQLSRAPLGAGESQPEKNWAGARVAGGASRLPAGEGLEQGWLAEPAACPLQPNSPQAFVSAMMTESGEIYSKLNKFLNVSDTDFAKAPQSICERCSTEY